MLLLDSLCKTYLYTFWDSYIMAIFGKKREREEQEAPSLPELPNLSDVPKDPETEGEENRDYSYSMPELSKEIKELPSFPDSEFGNSNEPGGS